MWPFPDFLTFLFRFSKIVIICRKCQMGKINRWWQREDNVRDVMLLVQRLTPLNNIWFHLSLTNKTSLVYKFSFRWRGHKDANDDHVHEEGVEGVGDDCFLVTERLSDWWHRHFRDCLEWIVSRISDISHHHESYFTLRKSSSRTEPPLTSCPRAYTAMPWSRFTSCAQL